MKDKRRFGYFQLGSSSLLLALACASAQAAVGDPAVGACVDIRGLTVGTAGTYPLHAASGYVSPAPTPASSFAPQPSAPQALAYAPQAYTPAVPAQQVSPIAPRAYSAPSYAQPVAPPRVAHGYQAAPVPTYAQPMAIPATAYPAVAPVVTGGTCVNCLSARVPVGPSGSITPEQQRLQQLNQQYAVR